MGSRGPDWILSPAESLFQHTCTRPFSHSPIHLARAQVSQPLNLAFELASPCSFSSLAWQLCASCRLLGTVSWRLCRQGSGFDSPWRCGSGTASLLERAPVVVEPLFRCCVAAGQVNSPPPFHPISPPLTPPQRAPRPFPNSLPLPTTLTTPHRACWQAITATQAPIPVALIVLGAACEVDAPTYLYFFWQAL